MPGLLHGSFIYSKLALEYSPTVDPGLGKYLRDSSRPWRPVTRLPGL